MTDFANNVSTGSVFIPIFFSDKINIYIYIYMRNWNNEIFATLLLHDILPTVESLSCRSFYVSNSVFRSEYLLPHFYFFSSTYDTCGVRNFTLLNIKHVCVISSSSVSLPFLFIYFFLEISCRDGPSQIVQSEKDQQVAVVSNQRRDDRELSDAFPFLDLPLEIEGLSMINVFR
uniref:Uncharacterized protein n=1 Tax=Heterorhabditis bacteriophora TaxID=37862 RepID=A0A1I7X2D2_HETBA